MVGLNVEMGRELLWRAFPSNQLGTYFDRSGRGRTSTLTRGATAAGRSPNPAPRENFVMLLRGALLRRYPNALIYSRPPSGPPTSRRVPSEVVKERSCRSYWRRAADITFSRIRHHPDQAVGSGTARIKLLRRHPAASDRARSGSTSTVSVGSASHLSIRGALPDPAHLQVPRPL